ncbi:MAG: DUF58 domain-containing protein [Candidatus Tectomicrobia bacterium]|nr:DUF58 domain-containing protein [Candidatus Tectomicrobia bacterium]
MDFGTWYAHVTRRADLRLRDRVQTLMQGTHGSTFRGRGEDFEFFQPHGLGEDTAHIDWKASERLEDGLLVRRLREERVLEVWIAADLSASMFTGFSAENCKQRLLLDLMAIIGRSVIGQQDLLGFVGFDSNIRTVVQPFRSEKTFINLLKTIWDHRPESGDATSLLPALRFFETQEGASQQKKKRLLLLLSDFETEDEWLSMAQRIAVMHPVLPVVLEEAVPEYLPASAGLLTYRDVESGQLQTVDAGAWLRLLHKDRQERHSEHTAGFDNSGLAGLFVSRESFNVDVIIDYLQAQRP